MILKPRLFRKPNLGHPLAKGLVGYWLMNEGAGSIINDLSGNGGIGTIVDTVNWRAGKTGSALLFGGGHVSLPSAYRPIDNLSEFSVVTCVKATSLSADGGIFYTETHTTSDPLLLWFDNAATDHIASAINTAGGMSDAVYSSFVPLPNVWYHLVLTYRAGDYLRLYINGIEDTGADFPVDASTLTTLDPTDTNYTIGDDDTGGKALTGYIDFFSLYNRTLSAQQIAQLYREPYCMFKRDPIELWVGSVGAGAPPVGAAGIMTPNTGYWGPTF